MGRVCVSSCRCCVFLSVVHPVAIMSAVFCVICSLFMCVSDASGCCCCCCLPRPGPLSSQVRFPMSR